MQAPAAALPGAVWDGRFRLSPTVSPPPGLTLGALGADLSELRRARPRLLPPDWPAAVLRTLPALREASHLVAVPALGYPNSTISAGFNIAFRPAVVLSAAPFLPI